MEVALPNFVEIVFVQGAKYVGIICIVIGVLHFVLPRVIFL
jgi:chromate transport protein ChrA